MSTSTQRFRDLYKATDSMCSINNQINYNYIVQKKHERWNCLALIWINDTRAFGRNIFADALMHIFTGSYTSLKAWDRADFIDMIEDTIINDDEAMYIWTQTDSFCKAVRYLYKQIFEHKPVNGHYSYEKYQFIKGLSLILTGKNISDVAKKVLSEICYPYNISNLHVYNRTCNNVEKVIATILPHSSSWTRGQMCDMTYICREINMLYNSNISCSSEIEALFQLTEYKQKHQCYLVNIVYANISYPLANAIFGLQTDEMLIGIYNAIITYLEDIVDKNTICNSWIHKVIEPWAYNENHPMYNEARKTIFNTTFAI